MTLSTHVLDTARGRPAAGVRVTVELQDDDGWRGVGGGVTDADGRVPGLVAGALAAGTHRLTFATGDWFRAQGVTGFYPEVSVVCQIEGMSTESGTASALSDNSAAARSVLMRSLPA